MLVAVAVARITPSHHQEVEVVEVGKFLMLTSMSFLVRHTQSPLVRVVLVEPPLLRLVVAPVGLRHLARITWPVAVAAVTQTPVLLERQRLEIAVVSAAQAAVLAVRVATVPGAPGQPSPVPTVAMAAQQSVVTLLALPRRMEPVVAVVPVTRLTRLEALVLRVVLVEAAARERMAQQILVAVAVALGMETLPVALAVRAS